MPTMRCENASTDTLRLYYNFNGTYKYYYYCTLTKRINFISVCEDVCASWCHLFYKFSLHFVLKQMQFLIFSIQMKVEISV